MKVAIFDGCNLIFRAFYAVKQLNNSTGIPTNAVVGCLKIFKNVLHELNPDFAIVCWDSGKKNFRHDQDESYKANRPKVHDDLKIQFSLVKEAFELLDVNQIVCEDGFEGDDLIGTLAYHLGNIDYLEPYIISSDKDFLQLLQNENIKIYSHAEKLNRIIDKNAVLKKYDVEPYQLVHIKALTGEKTDNIQGIPGIGPVTATKLIKEYQTVKNIIKAKHSDDKIVQKVIENVDIVSNAFALAKINTDIPLPESANLRPISDLKVRKKELLNFFDRLQMNSFIENFYDWANIYSYKQPIFDKIL